VRLIERNYYVRIFSSAGMIDPSLWMSQLAEDLRNPRFSMPPSQAMARRLRRNYGWLFLILLLAWLLKTTSSILQPDGRFIHSTNELLANASVGEIPGWVVLLAITSFYLWMLYIMIRHRESAGELAYGEVHV